MISDIKTILKKSFPSKLREPAERLIGRRVYHTRFDQMKCIFIHIPKTAGTSIGTALFSDGRTGHWKAKAYQWTNNKKFKSYYKFTVVRNPWDRAASAYFYLSRGGKNQNDEKWAKENLKNINSFDQFVTTWMNNESIYSWGHFVPQVDFLKNECGTIDIDYIGRFEQLREDFLIIQKKLNSRAELKLKNSSYKPPYRNLYTKQTRQIIHDLYREDIETFNYEF